MFSPKNGLAALTAAIAAGVPAEAAAEAIAEAPPPPGRFEVVRTDPHVVIDYAHTPDALQRTLGAARKLTSGQLTVVFGAGGERDQEKRPMMGQAARLADRVVLTSDNPRSEDPALIAAAIRTGLDDHPHVEVVLDRAEAIRQAVRRATRGTPWSSPARVTRPSSKSTESCVTSRTVTSWHEPDCCAPPSFIGSPPS